jgi:O-antigen/teichoic acid export membrane protein
MRKAFGTVSVMWLASLGGSALAFLTQVVLARALAPAGYGAFAAALATVTLVVPLAGFGVSDLWLKAFGAEGSSAVRWLPASFCFAALSTAAVFVVLVAWTAWGPHETATRQLLYWLSPVCAGQLLIGLVGAKLQLEERYGAFAIWNLLPNLARLFLVLLLTAMATQTTPSAVATAYALVAVAVAASGVVLLRAMSQGHFVIKGHSSAVPADGERRAVAHRIRLRDVVQEASPFGLGSVFHLIYFQSAIVMLQYLQGGVAAGIYNVAFIVMAAAYLLPSTVFQKFLLPKIHRWANHDRARFLQVYRFGNGLMLLLGVVTAVAIFALGPWLVPLLFGAAYREASALLKLLAFCVPMRFLASSAGAALMTQDNMRRKNLYMAAVAVINVLLNLSLIPLLAATGAAIATLLSEIILLALYLIAVRRHVFGPEAWRGWTLRYRSSRV